MGFRVLGVFGAFGIFRSLGGVNRDPCGAHIAGKPQWGAVLRQHEPFSPRVVQSTAWPCGGKSLNSLKSSLTLPWACRARTGKESALLRRRAPATRGWRCRVSARCVKLGVGNWGGKTNFRVLGVLGL